MSVHEGLIARLADLAGVMPGFRDQNGNWVETPLEARRKVLEGFGLVSSTIDETRESLARVAEVREALVPALIPALADAASYVPIRSDASEAQWRLTNEAGVVREGVAAIADGQVILPPLGAGYYALELEAAGARAKATIISAPARCYMPDAFNDGARMWGTVAQVYGLKTPWNMGIGEFSDIAEAVDGTARLGGDFVGLSPLHALFTADRAKYSPYSPNSRLFLESLHLDVTAIPNFGGSRAAALMDSADFKEKLEALRGAELVDHQAIWTLKKRLLELLFDEFQARGGSEDFTAFRANGGEPLELHATFEALSEHFSAEKRVWPGEWPEDFRLPQSDVVQWFREEKSARVTFHAWLQYLADAQLATAASHAKSGDMRIGLYRDLAVGGDRGGSEVWAAPEQFSQTLSVGAPPDPLGPQGQNWGLPPMDPFALERDGLKSFRALVTANMRHAGAIRIDHAFQLQRLFLIPEGGHAANGAYIAYPFQAMLAVLRLESHRARCIVIAEDLGTAPDGFSDAIMHAGILSYRVMYFERGDHGRFKKPGEYPRDAMAVFTTHDLPTLRGWWRGLDIDLREQIGVFDQERAANERGGRAHDVAMFSQALHDEKLLESAAPPPAEPPLDAAVRYIARASSALAAIQFEDAANEVNQANLPGISEGHPNWRRRLTQTVEELTAPESQLARWAGLMKEEGRVR